MKNKILFLLGTAVFFTTVDPAFAQSTTFTYQGRLNSSGASANGIYDFQFTIFDSTNQPGNIIAGPITNSFLTVSNGLFTTTLDFGSGPFNGQHRWLGVGVRTNGSGAFTTLNPRQEITPAPYAITATYLTVVAANDTVFPGTFASVGGGVGNTGAGFYATVGGGELNYGGGDFATIGGGRNNNATANDATVGGGNGNSAVQEQATVAGGGQNSANGTDSAVGGGYGNQIFASYATIPGGYNNSAAGFYSFAAGQRAKANHQGAFVWADSQAADFSSTINDQFSVRAGGGARFVTGGAGLLVDNQLVLTSGNGLSIQPNASGAPNVIGGSPNNYVSGGVIGATIGGGGAVNYLGSSHYNQVNANFGIVGGGFDNTAAGFSSAVLGGANNGAGGSYGTVGGGLQNINTGDYATIGGGLGNSVSTAYATIGGGLDNFVNAGSATVPGGYSNTASGTYSFAAGNRAKANHQGSFVWADSQSADFASTTTDQFNIRAQGGVRINDDTSMSFGANTRQMLNLWGTQYGIGVQSYTLYFRTDSSAPGGGFSWFKGGVHTNTQNNPGPGGTEMMRLDQNGNLNVRGSVTANSLILASDRDTKENFTPVDAQAMLDKVVSLPITRWNFKQDAATPHVGPMAQDFHAAFGLNGSDDKHIAVVDESGVALAAIQGLNQKLEQKEMEMTELRRKNDSLEKRLEALEKMLVNQKSK